MEIILTEDVPNLGSMGELVRVKPGYGRNYLIPRKLAILATTGNKKQLAHHLRQLEEKKIRLKGVAEVEAKSFSDLSVTITRQSGTEDKLFGSVSSRDIEAALAAVGITVERRKILLKDQIRNLGIYHVGIALHSEVTATVTVWVVAA
jgi:large subunit ribosomal protein L9